MKNRERRSAPRNRLTGCIAILNGTECELKDWSKEGALVTGYEGDLISGDTAIIVIKIQDRSTKFTVNGNAKIVRRFTDGQSINLGLKWEFKQDDLSKEKWQLFDFFFSQTQDKREI